MKKVYLASPFFNDKEIAVMASVRDVLRGKGLDVFVPNEHQNKHLEFGSMEWRKATFNGDVAGIDNADVVVAILDGNYSDSGTCWECSYAYCNNIPLVVVNLEGKTINLMIAESLHAIIPSLEALENYDFDTLPKIEYTDYVW